MKEIAMWKLRGLALFACWLAVVPVLQAQKPAAKRLSAAEAKGHKGETATVCGKVASARYASRIHGGPTFVNLDEPYPKQLFVVVIWEKDRPKFGVPEQKYRGQKICVTGEIILYAGVPEIIALDPSQIKVQ